MPDVEIYGLLMSTDGPGRFDFMICVGKDGLRTAVAEAMYHPAEEMPKEQLDDEFNWLLEDGKRDFEDGWLELAIGVDAIQKAVMGRVNGIVEDAQFDLATERGKRNKAEELFMAEHADKNRALDLLLRLQHSTPPHQPSTPMTTGNGNAP